MSSRPCLLMWRKCAAMAFMPRPLPGHTASQLRLRFHFDDAVAGIEESVAPLDQDAVDVRGLRHGIASRLRGGVARRIGSATVRSQFGQSASSQLQMAAQVVGQRVEHGPVPLGRAKCTLTQQRGQLVFRLRVVRSTLTEAAQKRARAGSNQRRRTLQPRHRERGPAARRREHGLALSARLSSRAGQR